MVRRKTTNETSDGEAGSNIKLDNAQKAQTKETKLDEVESECHVYRQIRIQI